MYVGMVFFIISVSYLLTDFNTICTTVYPVHTLWVGWYLDYKAITYEITPVPYFTQHSKRFHNLQFNLHILNGRLTC